MRPRGVAATILLLAAALAVGWACVVLLSGGFTLGRLVSRDPIRPLILGLLLAAVARAVSPLDVDVRVARFAGPRERWPARAAIVAAAAVFVVAAAWNTRAVGGSDSSCYALQADAFAHGHAVLHHPLAGKIPDAAPAMFAPAGFIPSPRDPFVAVPICAPGLSLAMAIFERAAGRAALFLVVPLCAAACVWLTFLLGCRLDDEATGVAAAILLACSPIFLYQAVQPMSDVPATAFWLGALIGCARGDRAGQIAGGASASLAVLTRPNLAAAIVPLAWLLAGRSVAESQTRDRRAWMWFGLAAAPGLLALALLNDVRYGSPLASGYGRTGALFSFAHVAANAPRYVRWLVETQSVFIACSVAAPVIVSRGRRFALVCSAAVILVVATYLSYTVFDDWWYLRFLLPIIPVLLAFMIVTVRRAAVILPRPVVFAGVTALAISYAVIATHRHVFDLQRLESRFVRSGEYAARQLPSNAVVLAAQQSGSVRFYAGLPTISWDAVPAGGLDALVSGLRSRGYVVFAALEDAEAQPFRERFQGQRCGALAERPIAEVVAAVRVRVYRLGCATSSTLAER
jgi:Dolichyl-phosphate-mannose-protein mannosyltransferase